MDIEKNQMKDRLEKPGISLAVSKPNSKMITRSKKLKTLTKLHGVLLRVQKCARPEAVQQLRCKYC